MEFGAADDHLCLGAAASSNNENHHSHLHLFFPSTAGSTTATEQHQLQHGVAASSWQLPTQPSTMVETSTQQLLSVFNPSMIPQQFLYHGRSSEHALAQHAQQHPGLQYHHEPAAVTTTTGFQLQQFYQQQQHQSMETLPGCCHEHLFYKVVTPSDVGKLNRLVIPKQHAERCFPLDPCLRKKGRFLSFHEAVTGKVWWFRYSYWNSSQSYVFTKGWIRFVKENSLKAGDIVSFERGARQHEFYISCRKRPRTSSEEKNTTGNDSHNNGSSDEGGTSSANCCSNNSEDVAQQQQQQQVSYYQQFQQQQQQRLQDHQQQQASSAAAASGGSSVRLFGVDVSFQAY